MIPVEGTNNELKEFFKPNVVVCGLHVTSIFGNILCMKCPSCENQEIQSCQIGPVKIDSCEKCGGLWFDTDELRKVKDIKISDANWFDIDLWKDESKFSSVVAEKTCPKCEKALYRIKYDNSDIEIDICKDCKGIWLDKGEFEKVLKYIKDTSYSEIVHNYTKNLVQEIKEVFTGPENFKSEVADVLMLVDFFKYKFLTQHEKLSRVLINLPRV